MNKYISIILMVVLTLLTGIWLDHNLPHYGTPLGVGLGLAFAIGFLTKR